MNVGRSVFSYFARFHLSAEGVRDILHTVAYSEHGDAEVEKRVIAFGGVVEIYAVRSARENDTDRVYFLDLFDGRACGLYHGIHVHTAHRARNEFLVLAAKVHNENSLIFHMCS